MTEPTRQRQKMQECDWPRPCEEKATEQHEGSMLIYCPGHKKETEENRKRHIKEHWARLQTLRSRLPKRRPPGL